MKRFLKILVVCSVVVVATVCFGLWLVLKSPFFDEARKDLLEETLTEVLGYRTVIEGRLDVALSPSDIGQLHVTDLVLPGGLPSQHKLAVLRSAKITIDVSEVLQGTFRFLRLDAEGLLVNIYSDGEGGRTLIEADDGASDVPSRLIDSEIAGFLLSQDVAFSDFRIRSFSKSSGLEFEAYLNDLTVDFSREDAPTDVRGQGEVNGLPFELEGVYTGSTGQTLFQFEETDIELNTRTFADGKRGYESEISLTTLSLKEIYQALKLDAIFEGAGTFSARLVRSLDEFSLSDISVSTQSTKDRLLTVTGRIGDLSDLSDIDLVVGANLSQLELKLPLDGLRDPIVINAIDLQALGRADMLELQNVRVEFGGLDGNVESIGPFSIGELTRTQDNKLNLTGIELGTRSIYESETLFKGEVGDLLKFKNFKFEGNGRFSIQEAFSRWAKVDVDELGFIDFKVSVDDETGSARIKELSFETTDDDFVLVRGDASIDDLGKFDGVSIELEANELERLARLARKSFEFPEDFPMNAQLRGTRVSGKFENDVSINFGGSNLALNLVAEQVRNELIVRGNVTSEAVTSEDIDQVSSLVSQALGDTSSDEGDSGEKALVVPPGSVQMRIPGFPEVRQLVIDQNTLPARVAQIVEGLAARIDFELSGLKGFPGISSISTPLSIESGIMKIEPFKVPVGGATVQTGAEINLLENPDTLRLFGRLDGLRLNDLAQLANLGVAAEGLINARFDVSGKHASFDAFLGSASGELGVFLKNGKIGTSIIELSGFGFLPWLFSQELFQGFSHIACVSAPIRVRNGAFVSDAAVLETQSVQVVLQGTADPARNVVDIRGEARPVGLPFAPSHHPFRVHGRLTEPEFELLAGVRRQGLPRQRIQNRRPCVPDIRQVGAR